MLVVASNGYISYACITHSPPFEGGVPLTSAFSAEAKVEVVICSTPECHGEALEPWHSHGTYSFCIGINACCRSLTDGHRDVFVLEIPDAGSLC